MNTRMGWMVLLAAASVLGPMLRSSEAGGRSPRFRDVVLYELNEQAQIVVDPEKPEQPPQRIATSGLDGKARRGTPLCPEHLMAYAEAFYAQLGITVRDVSQCRVVAFGRSQLDTVTWLGTIGGDFYVVVNSDKTNFVDAPELVVLSGTFTGVISVADEAGVLIDISSGSFDPTQILPGFPGGLPASESFRGKFRLPFKVQRIAVYKTDRGEVVPVGLHERALGNPTVRVEITFDREIGRAEPARE
jgi:hypothetical protein